MPGRRRAISLLEVMVASSLFLAMTLLLLGLLSQNRKAGEKAMGHTDASGQATLLLERMRMELRHSRVVGVRGDNTLLYWRARMLNDLPQLDQLGHVDWLPGWPADAEVAELNVARHGNLQRRTGQGIQILSNLGADGALQFAWNPGLATLGLSGTVGVKDRSDPSRSNIQTFQYQVCLNNLE